MSEKNFVSGRKILSAFLAFIMIFSGFSAAFPAATMTVSADTATQEPGEYVVVATSLTIRSSASTAGTALGAVWQGVVVNVTEISNGWGKITHGNATGWVSMEYLMEYVSDEYGTYQVTASSLNIRSDKTTGSTIVGSAAENDYVTGVKKDGSWTYILFNGLRGWVSNIYLRKIDGTIAEQKNVIIVGAIVRIKQGSEWIEGTEEYGNSKVISKWVFEKDLVVYSINGERVVVGDDNGNIIGVININDLILVSGGKSEINLDVDTSKGRYSRITDVSQIVDGSRIIIYDSINKNILLPDPDTVNTRINPLKDVTEINYTDTQYAWEVDIVGKNTYLIASNGQYIYAKNGSKETYFDIVTHNDGDTSGAFTFNIDSFFLSVATSQPSFVYYYAPGDYYRFYKNKESDNIETPGLTFYIYDENNSSSDGDDTDSDSSNIKIGDIVGIKDGAKDYYGKDLTQADYDYKQYKVIGLKGNRAVLEKTDGYAFDHPMNTRDLYIITHSSDSDTDSDSDPDDTDGFLPDSYGGAYSLIENESYIFNDTYIIMYDRNSKQILLPNSNPAKANTVQGAKVSNLNFNTSKYAWKVEKNIGVNYLKTSDGKYLHANYAEDGAFYSNNFSEVTTALNNGQLKFDLTNHNVSANTSTRRYLYYNVSSKSYGFYENVMSGVEAHEIYLYVFDPSKSKPGVEDNLVISTDTDSPTDTDTSGDNTIVVGSKVGVKNGAKFYDGKTPSSWVYNAEFIVASINGDRVAVSRDGTVIGAFHMEDLYLISGGKPTDTDSSSDTDTGTDTDSKGSTIIVGSIVGVKDGATYFDGTKPSSWVYDYENFVVYSIKGERVTVTKDGTVIGAFNIKDLYLVSGGGSAKPSDTDSSTETDSDPSTGFKVGDVVRLKDGKNWYDGTKPSSWVYTTDLVIYSIKGDRVVLTRNGSIVGAANINDLVLSSTNTSDKVAPVVSDVKVIDVTDISYTVTCYVTDNVAVKKVVFKTYLEADGASTAVEKEVTVSGTMAVYTVSIKDHNNKAGKYVTVVTAYDAAGNASASATVSQELKGAADDKENPVITDVKISEVTGKSYKVTCTVKDNIGIDKVSFYTWTTANGKDDAIYHTGTVSGNTATCVIRSTLHNSESGEYNTQVVAYDLAGNKAESEAVTVTLDGSSSGSEYTPTPEGTGSIVAEGIDVSKWQGTIDWEKVKDEVDYVIIRCGYSGTIDPQFEKNYEGAKAAGIPVGAYIYSYSTTVSGAEKDAENCIEWLKNKTFEYPIYFDIEDKKQLALSKDLCTDMVLAFANKMSEEGYLVGVYTGAIFMDTNLKYDSLKGNCEVWIARYYDYTKTDRWEYSKKYGAWQYSDRGTINGISGNVDLDVCYKDYPTIVTTYGYNGYKGTEVKPTQISLNKGDTTLAVGQDLQLTATLQPSNVTNKTISWTTSDASVATVSSNGLVTAVAKGRATITAKSSNGLTASINITVVADVTSLTLNRTALSIGINETFTLSASVTPSSLKDSITWESSNTNVVTVQNGIVKGVSGGSAVVKAICGNKTAICRVTVASISSITLDKTKLTMNTGESLTLGVTTVPSNSTVVWTTSDSSVVNVAEGYGLILAVGPGTATVTATSGGKSATCQVTVTNELKGIVLSNTFLSMKPGSTEKLVVKADPETAPLQSVSWKSSDTSVATVSGGTVKAIKDGTATITATCGSFTAKCEIKVISDVTGITLDKTVIYMGLFSVRKITATVSSKASTDQDISWSSSNPLVAVVIDGYVTSVTKGTTTITATCGGQTATCIVHVGTEVESIKLTKTVLDMVRGEKVKMKATVTPADAADQGITWSSSDESVATVTSSGIITAVNNGTAIITAECFGEKAECKVNVGVKPTSLILSTDLLNIMVNETSTIKAEISPSDATNQEITFKSNDSSVATVSSSGIVKGIAPGITTVTVTVGTISATCTVLVSAPVNSISLNKTSVELSIGQTETLKVTVSPDSAKQNPIVWTSSNTGVVTVEDGKLTAISNGNATITVKSADKSATCQVTVKTVLNSLSVDKASLSLIPGETENVKLIPDPLNASLSDAVWKSNDTSVANVDENGNVTAVNKGSTTVTVSCQGKSVTIKVYVGDPVNSITLDKTSLTMSIGQSSQLNATVSPSNSGEVIGWSSSNLSVAVVDANGKVTAVGNGDATITAKIGGKTAQCSVKVTTGLNEIKLDATEKTLGIGQKYTFKVTLNPSNTSVTVYDLKWESSNEQVAKVENGTVTALALGEAVITASYGNVQASCNIKVESSIVTNDDSELVIDRDKLKIYNVDPGTTKAELENAFITHVVIVDSNGNEVADNNAIVCTGFKVQLISDGKVSDELMVVVMGDVNGDGNVNMKDAVLIQMKTANIDISKTSMNYYKEAADINFDGSENMKDVVLIQQYIVGIYKTLFFTNYYKK